MSESRKQFEIWHAINHASLAGSAGTSPAARKRALCMKEVLFVAWQASRDAVVIELPLAPSIPEDPEEAIDDSHMDAYHSAIRMRDGCAKSITAAGVKVSK